jgi:hypothetical protein
MPPYPWPAVIGLTYIPSAVIILVFVHKALYRKELADSMSVSTGASERVPQVIWISSLDHLKRFGELPWYSKWFGLLPAGFPKVKAGLLFSPLLYFAQANLSLSQNLFTCQAFVPPTTAMKSYADLSSTLRLSLSPNQISSVTRFDMRQVLPTALPLPFIRIQATSGELHDFLVCAGSGDVSAIGRETGSLWHALAALKAAASRRTPNGAVWR